MVDPSGDQYAAYLNWRVAPSPELTLDAGLRWDAQSLEGMSEHRLAPRVGLLWMPDDATRLRASSGRFNQAQGIDELQVSDGETRFFPAQQADHWVASAERRIGRDFNLRIEAYRKSYRGLRPRLENMLDSPVVLPELRPDRIRIEPRSATADGAELTLEYGEMLALEGHDLQLVHGRGRDRRQVRASQLGPDAFRQRGRHSPWPAMGLERGRNVAQWVADDRGRTRNPRALPIASTGPRNERHLSDYARLDFRVARHFAFSSGQSLTVFLDVSNLTNRRNDCCTEYQIETDSNPAFLDVSPVEALPIIPSIGFVWEF